MSESKPLDATFFAFKKRDRRFVLTGAAAAYYVVVLLVSGGFIALTWNLWSEVIAWYFGVVRSMSSGSEPSAPPPELIMGLAPFYLAFIPVSLFLFAIFEAACLRWLVRGEQGGGLFGLKVDGDTWRVFAVYWIWIGYFLVVCLAIGLFYGLLALLAGLADALRFIVILVGALAPIGIAALLIWGGVLFAPAAATSVGRRRLTFVSARRVSAPRYWPLLTSFFLVIVGYFVITTVISSLLQIPISQAMAPVTAAMMTGGDFSQAMAAMQETMLTPAMIAILAVNVLASFLLATVYYIAMFGVNARAFEAAAEAGDIERA